MTRKRIIRAAVILLCAALTLSCALGAASASSGGFGEIRYVDTPRGSNVRLREEPNTSSTTLASIPNGTAVTTFGYVTRNWIDCSYRGQRGYIYAQYLSLYPPEPRPVPVPTPRPQPIAGLFSGFTPANYQVVVTPTRSTGFVNLRWAPSLDVPVMNHYYNGTVLDVLYQNAEWCQVYDRQNNLCGFMMRAYLSYYDGGGYGEGYGVGYGAANDADAFNDGVSVVGVPDGGDETVVGVPDDDGAVVVDPDAAPQDEGGEGVG